jgi:parallel beta-helix repeat protein
MKSNTRSKIIILITLGILFAFLPIFINNPRFTARDRDITSNYNNEFDHENLKLSAVSGKIHIDGNSGWTAFKAAGNCTGNGTISEPYVIEDLEIDGEGSGPCIFIENSDVYFRIENCTLYNAGVRISPNPDDRAGIRLLNVDNSQLINNNCSSNPIGILLESSDNNTISENIVNNNSWIGIRLIIESDNNIISGNTVNNNTTYGLCSFSCFFNNFSTNVFKNNNIIGIYTNTCDNITISGNTVINSMHGMFIASDMYGKVLGNDLHNNSENGLFIRAANCIISGNNASYNAGNGIFLEGWWSWVSGANNTISGNIANYNHVGIRLEGTDNNIISGNTLIGNDICIVELNCQGNIIQDNDCTFELSLNYLPSILIISTAIIGVSVFMIYKNGKMFKKPQEDLDFL